MSGILFILVQPQRSKLGQTPTMTAVMKRGLLHRAAHQEHGGKAYALPWQAALYITETIRKLFTSHWKLPETHTKK